MGKHTDGPWFCGSADKHNYVDIYTNPSGGFNKTLIAEHVRTNDCRLIASAPDLLAALEAVLPLAELVTFGSHDNYSPSPYIAQARAAIARARGQA